MKRAFLRENGRSGIELIEEAFVLLRTCPPAILAIYFLGSIPFVAGFLIFWSDLSRHHAAENHLAGATLAMTALFIWMKACHARFGALLSARLRGEAPPAWGPGEISRSVVNQAAIHSSGLFVLPLALVAVLPFGWVYAFYQNASALENGRTRLGELVRSAARQSSLWPWQNHLILLVLSLFGGVVFLNWFVLGLLAPQSLNTFFGIETVFTRSPWSLANTTFFAGVCALTYLSTDPLIKALYALRCFYGNSLHSGDDLRSELRRVSGRMPAWVACLLFGIFVPLLNAAESPPASAPAPAVSGAGLDQSIREVIQQDKYRWRNPPEATIERKGIFEDFFKSIVRGLVEMLRGVFEWMEKFFKWLFDRDRKPSEPGDLNWAIPKAVLLFVVLAVVVSLLTILIMRLRLLRRRSLEATAIALAPAPDVADEDTVADQLPEDDWMRMGRSYLDQGELRLALRAFYLSSLAHLAARGLVTIVRSKSNREYEREVRRRGHATPELPGAFGENVGLIDRIWYGLHEASPETVQRFLGNLEKMKRVA